MGSFYSAPSCTPLNYVAIHVHVHLLMYIKIVKNFWVVVFLRENVNLSPQINWKSKLASCLSNSTPYGLLLLQCFLSQQCYSQNLQLVSVWAFLLFCFYFVVCYMITAGSLEISETKIYQNVFFWAHFICSERVNSQKLNLLCSFATWHIIWRLLNIRSLHKIPITWGWKDGSTIKNQYSSCRGPALSIQHPCQVSWLTTACNLCSRGSWHLLTL